MNLLARSLAAFFSSACFLCAWAGGAAPAAGASYATGGHSGSYSFAELFRTTVEAESALAAAESPRGPVVAPGPGVRVGARAPQGQPRNAAAVAAPALGPAVASPALGAAVATPALGPAAAQAPLPLPDGMPRPASWLMLISGLAIAVFIAWRRSSSAG